MRRSIGILALLLLLAALGVGGFSLYETLWVGEQSPQTSPGPVSPGSRSPDEFPVPELAGDVLRGGGRAEATLLSMRRAVKARRANELEWGEAVPRMQLYYNDAVRTLEDSSATIAFGENDIVEVGGNALVVIRQRRIRADAREISLALLSPDFLDSLESKPADERQQAIEAAAASRQVKIRTMSDGGGAAARSHLAVKTLPDKSTIVASLAGEVKLVGPRGDEVTLKKNMGTKITPQGELAEPRVLLQPPRLDRPRNGTTYAFLRQAPKVELGWKPVERARGYRVVVARDSAFRRVFAEENVSRTSFAIRNLSPGTYYWRVRSRDADGFEGAYSKPRSLKAVRDTVPPELAISEPPEMFVSPGPSVVLKGSTDPGARIRMNGQRVTVGADGRFTHTLTLKEGVNLITIEAVDVAGNTTYGKRLITYRGVKRSNTAGFSGE